MNKRVQAIEINVIGNSELSVHLLESGGIDPPSFIRFLLPRLQ